MCCVFGDKSAPRIYRNLLAAVCPTSPVMCHWCRQGRHSRHCGIPVIIYRRYVMRDTEPRQVKHVVTQRVFQSMERQRTTPRARRAAAGKSPLRLHGENKAKLERVAPALTTPVSEAKEICYNCRTLTRSCIECRLTRKWELRQRIERHDPVDERKTRTGPSEYTESLAPPVVEAEAVASVSCDVRGIAKPPGCDNERNN